MPEGLHIPGNLIPVTKKQSSVLFSSGLVLLSEKLLFLRVVQRRETVD